MLASKQSPEEVAVGNDNERLGLVEDGLLTVREAQDFTRLSRSDLYARMERGELAYVKIGRRRLVPRRALIELAQRGLVIRAAN
jgi:excisionase family DNA binding protein